MAEEEKPKRRRRRSKADSEATAEATSPSEAPRASETEGEAAASGATASRADAAPTANRDEPASSSAAPKARLVCGHLRGRSVEDGRAILARTPRAVARDWSKLLESAVANADNNPELVGEDLYVKAVHADEGPTIKRFRPRAMGRATKILKRTSHLTIMLTPKD